MPQKLSKVAPNASVIIGNAGDRPLARHPELSMLAMEAIASWSNVEAFLLRMFIELFGGHGAMAADIYLAFDNQTSKSRALSVAASKLTAEHQKLLRALLDLAETNKGLRDKLAHHTWGDSPNIPNGLLLVDPKATLGDDFDRDNIYVYYEVDFKNMTKANDRLCGFGLLFKFIVTNHVANREGRLYDQLCAEPEIQERLGSRRP
jgi:hypothetical protein